MADRRNFIVLRARRAFPTAEPFSLPGITTMHVPGATSAALESATTPLIEQAQLNSTEVADVASDPSVSAIAMQMPTKLIEPTNGPGVTPAAGPTWGIMAVGADSSPVNGSGVTVAVLDTGIDAAHPAFQGVQLDQRDFTGSGNGDVQGHGTHCAGTIFGRDVSGTRIGIARGVTKALIGKVLDNTGRGGSDMLFNAINWASENNAHVISMSLGFDFPGMVANLVAQGWPANLATSVALEAYRGNLRMFDRLMALIKARGAFGISSVVVAASGNESQRPSFEISASLPAAAEDVISVGALQQDGAANHKIASFSNTLPQISAPGVNIVSARVGGGLASMNGTSMACPHVAGLTALWWQVVRQSPLPPTADVVKARMLSAAKTSTLSAGVDVADRGVGLAMAPTTAQI